MAKEITDKFVEIEYERRNNPIQEYISFQNHLLKNNAGSCLGRYEAKSSEVLPTNTIRVSIYDIKDSTVIQEITDHFFKKQIGYRIAGKNKEEAVNFIKEFYKDYNQIK